MIPVRFHPAALRLLAAASLGAAASAACFADGPFVFPQPTTYFVGAGPTFVKAADMNSDGHIDLIVSLRDDNAVIVMLNNGNGVFELHGTTPVGLRPRGHAIGDVNGNGHNDVVVANWAEESSSVSVLLNDGAGGLTESQTVPLGVGVRPRVAALADVDMDGDLDIITANNFDDSVAVLLNNGAGQFTLDAFYTVGAQPGSVSAGDLNGNGFPDLVATNRASSSISVLFNDGAGGFVHSAELPTGPTPRDEAIVDLDGDGHPDVVTANGGAGGTISVFFNDGAGGLTGGENLGSPTTPHGLAVVDFDGDGTPDLAYADAESAQFQIRRNLSDGTFSIPQVVEVGGAQLFMAAADFDGDGRIDVATVDGVLRLRVQFNLKSGGPDLPGDFNGNGFIDGEDLAILLANWGSDNPVFDLNDDGVVNGADLAILLANW